MDTEEAAAPPWITAGLAGRKRTVASFGGLSELGWGVFASASAAGFATAALLNAAPRWYSVTAALLVRMVAAGFLAVWTCRFWTSSAPWNGESGHCRALVAVAAAGAALVDLLVLADLVVVRNSAASLVAAVPDAEVVDVTPALGAAFLPGLGAVLLAFLGWCATRLLVLCRGAAAAGLLLRIVAPLTLAVNGLLLLVDHPAVLGATFSHGVHSWLLFVIRLLPLMVVVEVSTLLERT